MSKPLEANACRTGIRGVADLVPALKPEWREQALRRLNSLTKPIGSLGRLEELAARLVAIQEREFPDCVNKTIFTLAADHGVTDEGVSAYPKEVTKQMVRNFLSGGAAINVLCRQFQIEVVIVDIGVDGTIETSDALVKKKIANGTKNIAEGPAMSEAEMTAALDVGVELAKSAARRERTVLGTGEMGIGNTTAASAIAAALTGRPVVQVTGCGAGLDAEAVKRKVQVIERAIRINRPDASDPLDILRKLGGFEIAGLTGLILGAAVRRIPVIVDGFISTAAAAIAYAIQPRVRDFMFAAHRSSEPGHTALLEFIGQRPLLDLEMRLGEGTGAALAIAIMDAATKLFNEMATFTSAGVSGVLA
jgi:nicotinate-nucleotide--dimethylbenzimidazole phosphoribosyltransferase